MRHNNTSSIGLTRIFKGVILAGVVSTSVLSSPIWYDAFDNEVRVEYDREFEKTETETLEPDNFKAISKSESLRVLENIQRLPENWNGYGGKVIPKAIIDQSRNIIMVLDYQPEIFPTARRTIQMEYELDDGSYLEFEVYSDHISVLEVPERDYSKAVNGTIPKTEYAKLPSIVLKFHGGIDHWKNPIEL